MVQAACQHILSRSATRTKARTTLLETDKDSCQTVCTYRQFAACRERLRDVTCQYIQYLMLRHPAMVATRASLPPLACVSDRSIVCVPRQPRLLERVREAIRARLDGVRWIMAMLLWDDFFER